MKEFSCIADLNHFIESFKPEQIKSEIVGTFGNDRIKIEGKRLCKTVLGSFFALRWINLDSQKGLFSKGLCFYNYTQNNFFNLKTVK
jgi:hypothetical protein